MSAIPIDGLCRCPTLSSERLVFKPLREEDAGNIVYLLSDYETVLMLTYAPWPYTAKDALTWFNHINWMCGADVGRFWGVHDLKDNFIGTAGLSLFPEHQKAELHYWLGKAYWGKGYGTEAAKYIIQYSFVNFDIERLEVNHMVRNIRSQRVIEKCGFRFEGTMRSFVKRFGKFEDVKVYSLVRSEFEATKKEVG